MNLIDVHIVRGPNENPEWWERCTNSLQGHPINVHVVDRVEKDIRAARYNGFSQGTAPYVSFVDPDDYVLPETFEKCLDVIQTSPDNVCGVYTMSNTFNQRSSKIKPLKSYMPWNIDYMRHPSYVHQIVVYKRDILLDVFSKNFNRIPNVIYTEYTLHCLMAIKYDWIAINHIGYVWRIHSQGIHNKFNTNSVEPSNQTSQQIKKRCLSYIQAGKNFRNNKS